MSALATIAVDRGLTVAMPDGIRLATDVFRPAGPGRHPVVLLRTPYDRGQAAAFGLQINALHLVDAGFVVVTQDVRGRFASEGRFEPFRAEAADGVATIEWAAEQPWSDGAVAMAGMSYCGYAQVLAARRRPDALRAWIPAFCPLDARSQWIYDGDAFQLAFNLAWSLASIAAPDRRTADASSVLDALDAWPETVRRDPAEQRELLATPAGSVWGDWLARRDDERWWSESAAAVRVSTTPPRLSWAAGSTSSTAGRSRSTQSSRPGEPTTANLLMGPWDHSPLPLSSASGDSEFGWRAIVDLPALTLSWLDHALRGGPAPLPRMARTFATGADTWLDWDVWPPAAESLTLWAAPGGRLVQGLPPAPGADRVTTDADDPAPAMGGRMYSRPRHVRPGQMDQRARAGRPDVVAYAAEAAATDTLLAGPVRAEVWTTSSRAGPADVVVTLVDVAPDGCASNVAEGVARHSLHADEPLCARIDLGHVAHVVRRGHRLRLDVAAAAFPRVDRAPAHGRSERAFLHGGSSRLSAVPAGRVAAVAGH